MPITSRTGYANRQYLEAGSAAEKRMNYSRAIRDGEWIFVSNTSGYHYDENRIDDDVEGQARQMVANITNVLAKAGASPKDIVRIVMHCPNASDLPKVRETISGFFADIRPTATVVCTPLASAALKIEMEVTARVTTGN
ncbi:Rid family hydrolase [Aminobacter sp. UC22_36]|uniref:Rid family hydrolase n=1 Tax=Aminobacter sp. UC22_36 TaxID=3374549 RepID=UPI003756D51C